jgi:hypothetical protein
MTGWGQPLWACPQPLDGPCGPDHIPTGPTTRFFT